MAEDADAVDKWRASTPAGIPPDRHVFTRPWPAGPTSRRPNRVICYQYRADRARRARRGLSEQGARAGNAVAPKALGKRNRFVALDGATKTVNRELRAKARSLAWLKGV
jgi:hypothetical protein